MEEKEDTVMERKKGRKMKGKERGWRGRGEWEGKEEWLELQRKEEGKERM